MEPTILVTEKNKSAARTGALVNNIGPTNQNKKQPRRPHRAPLRALAKILDDFVSFFIIFL